MKRIFSMALCLILAVVMLVSCGDDDIKQLYDPPVEKEQVSLNLYIICDEGSDKAKNTVMQRIADYTASKYQTTVNVKYCTPSEYADKISAAFSGTEGTDSADLFLINSKEMYDSLQSEGKLADLTQYMDSEEYGMLNAQIASSLLAASRTDDKYYCIPNNRVVGEYEYIAIDKNVAREYYYSDKVLYTYTDINVLQNNLWSLIKRAGKNPEDYITAIESTNLGERFMVDSFYANLVKEPEGENTKYQYLFVRKSLVSAGVSEETINSWKSIDDVKASTVWADKGLALGQYVELVTVNEKFTEAELKLADGIYYCNAATDGNKYIVIDKAEADSYTGLTEEMLSSYVNYSEMQTVNLWDKLLEENKNPEDYIKVVKGSYSYRYTLESEGKICNISKYPTPTKDDAYASAYAISASYAYPDRAMEILYALNVDIELRNYLQFGIHGTNYELEHNMIVRTSEDDRGYIINPFYVGNIFKSLYCNDSYCTEENNWKWTEEDAAYGAIQNKESVYP